MTTSFKGAQFPKDFILHAVFFYLRHSVSYRNLEEILISDNHLVWRIASSKNVPEQLCRYLTRMFPKVSPFRGLTLRGWFTAMHATPVSADRSMPVLSVIMTVVEADGLRPEGSNPCKGIRRYRRQNRDRFLSEAEVARLGRALRGPRRSSPHLAIAFLSVPYRLR